MRRELSYSHLFLACNFQGDILVQKKDNIGDVLSWDVKMKLEIVRCGENNLKIKNKKRRTVSLFLGGGNM